MAEILCMDIQTAAQSLEISVKVAKQFTEHDLLDFVRVDDRLLITHESVRKLLKDQNRLNWYWNHLKNN